jgi:hypothetical protein
VENTHNAVTTSGKRSLDRYRRLTRRGCSASPLTHLHRLGQQRKRSNSRDRRGLTSTHARDTLFLRATQQLLLAGSPITVKNT